MKEEYKRDGVMEEVLKSESTEYRNLNTELDFHHALWLVYL